MQLIADLDPGNDKGDLIVSGSLVGNMTLSGTDVTVSGDVTSFGILDVDADDDVTLKKNVSSVGEMTMDAGDNIKLNETAGTKTTSNSDITLLANRAQDSTVDVVETREIDADGKVVIEGEGIKVDGDLTAGDFIELRVIDDMVVGGITNTAYVTGNVLAENKVDIQSQDHVKVDGGVTSNTKNINIQAGHFNTDNLRRGGIEIGGKVQTFSAADGDINIEILPNAGYPGKIADDDIKLHDDVDSAKSLTVIAQQGDVLADKKLESETQMYLESVDGSVKVDGKVDSGDTLTAKAGEDVFMKSQVVSASDMYMNAGDEIKLNQTTGDTTSGGDMKLVAGRRIEAFGKLITTEECGEGPGGKIEAYAGSGENGDDFTLISQVGVGNSSAYDVILHDGADAGGDLLISAGDDVVAGDLLTAGEFTDCTDGCGEMVVKAGDDITLEGTDVSARSGGDMTIAGDLDADNVTPPAPSEGFVTVAGDLLSGASIDISSSNVESLPGTAKLRLGGDVIACQNVLIQHNTKFTGQNDQQVWAKNGTITAGGFLNKVNCESDGSLYLLANGDISLADYVKAACCEFCCYGMGGGVSIISETASIFTPGAGGALNVDITGRSDSLQDIGVTLPLGPGRAAIYVRSFEPLNLGPDGKLTACGRYYSEGVDDRASIGFVSLDGTTIPAGGPERDEGDPFDLAIFVGSVAGDVDVSAPVEIKSAPFVDQIEVEGPEVVRVIEKDREEIECDRVGAMVVDAWETVTFDGQIGGQFEASLFGDGTESDVGDRLEVVSRLSEWLDDVIANDRLPYAASWTNPRTGPNPPFPDGYNYVLRGAGQENPDIVDEGTNLAWVLEPRPGVAPLAKEHFPEVQGCPVLLEAAALELGITRETLQVSLEQAMATTPNIQPCVSCAKLVNYASILRDADDQGFAAMAQIINDIAPAGAPFTPEMGASIASAFEANMGNPNMPQYAAAMDYIDAFVNYVAVVDTELGAPVENSLAQVMEKYGQNVLESENENVSTYLQIQLGQF